MSLEVSYMGRTIADLSGDKDCTLKTGGKFCEGDISLALREAGTEPSGTVSITRNGTVNVRDYASAEVNVPNGITAADEGKVVKNGALVAQTARATEITANGTYDTTENNSVTVNVSGASAVVQPLSVTQNGTYDPPSGVDGYAPVNVNVSSGGREIVPTIIRALNSYNYTVDAQCAMNPDSSSNGWGAQGSSDSWWEIHFPTAVCLSSITFANYFTYGSGIWYTLNATIQASNDEFSTSDTLLTLTDLGKNTDPINYSLNNTNSYKWYRIVCQRGENRYPGLSKISFQSA